jgi:biotin-(acetyl-CoA carboxylase) ligase
LYIEHKKLGGILVELAGGKLMPSVMW